MTDEKAQRQGSEINFGDHTNVHGDVVGGNKIGGDQFNIGSVANNKAVAFGSGAQANVHEGLSGEDLTRLFAAIKDQIKTRPEDPAVDKDELSDTVKRIEDEVNKQEQANPDKLNRWITTLRNMAPDIGDVVLKTLANPLLGGVTVIQKVLAKVEEQQQF